LTLEFVFSETVLFGLPLHVGRGIDAAGAERHSMINDSARASARTLSGGRTRMELSEESYLSGIATSAVETSAKQRAMKRR
jgi:hypothetical protein